MTDVARPLRNWHAIRTSSPGDAAADDGKIAA